MGLRLVGATDDLSFSSRRLPAVFLPRYEQEEMHVGLIALNTVAGVMTLELQRRLLLLALEMLEGKERWNEVLEISVTADRTFTVDRYDLPSI